MSRVIVFGSINIDYVISVSLHPLSGQTVLGSDLEQFPGGKGANQAIAAARLGAKTLMFGSVGKDAQARYLKDFLEEQGIDISNVRECDVSTGSAFIAVDNKGENTIIVSPSANTMASYDQFDAFQFLKSDIVVSQNEVPLDHIQKVFEKAKNAGAVTIYNPAPAIEVSNKLFEFVDYLIVNETESDFYKNKIETNDLVLVETLGSEGVKITSVDNAFRIPGNKVNVVDTTGAGDCFVGSFAYGLSNGQNLKEVVEFANKSAAISVQRSGAGVSMPVYEEVSKLIS